MTRADIAAEQRRRNVRTAWMLAGFVLFVFGASIPFWKGLYRIAMGIGG